MLLLYCTIAVLNAQIYPSDLYGPARLAKTCLKMEHLAMPDVANTNTKSQISTLLAGRPARPAALTGP